MTNDIKKIIVSAKEIDNICERLGKEITNDYQGKKPLFVGLLKGCQPFMSDLLKYVDLYCEIDYMKVSSYSGTESTGNIIIKNDISTPLNGKDVIIVDDIVDTGKTTKYIQDLFFLRKANSVKVCTLLDKPEGRIVDINVDYVGGFVPNEFVVGYGLDYNESYRNMPYIGVLKEEIYKK